MFEKIQEIISNQLSISPDKITPASTLSDDLDADSLDAVEIIMAAEDAFSIEIPDEDAEKFQSISDIIEYIEKHQ
ncbi:acyl carrier protein [Serpentinicella sp. ANB-PHB4]|uniref:acyl carrier protein n=1 Tax=Serpentinicella sp. ANB-PHB4 TaxID=3074076 RepID=UPI002862D759|nr:acyl carrier protein [Serpentinicella sp. ANB-PHB4]MDR5658753.1 acyl carrier protein [Serpentinicella sp. ANB-PHB4]